MNYLELIKARRLPTTWCPGCGIGIAVKALLEEMAASGMNGKNTVIVSGIGCSGRASGYFNMDSVHTLHGRAIPVAEGIKHANPALNVIVFSGDGDLAAIGGNHLLHSSRRKSPIKIICVNNRIYGMTGGQASPTTPEGVETISSPDGNSYQPINLMAIVAGHQNLFARSTVYHYVHLRKMIKKAIDHKGYSFVEVISNCYPNYGKKLGRNHPYDMLIDFKERYRINSSTTLKENELGATI